MLTPEHQNKLNSMAVLRLLSALVPIADLTGGLDVKNKQGQALAAATHEYNDRFTNLLADVQAALSGLLENPLDLSEPGQQQTLFTRFCEVSGGRETAHLQEPRTPGSYDVHAAADMFAKMLPQIAPAYAFATCTPAEGMHNWLAKYADKPEGRAWLLNEAIQLFVADAVSEKE